MKGTVFLQIGGKFPKMVPLLLPNFGSSLKSSNGTSFVCVFLYFSPIEPFLLQKGAKFLGGLILRGFRGF